MDANRDSGLRAARSHARPGPDLGDRFREAMTQFPSGLAAVTVADADGRPRALLVSSVAAYSASPPSVMAAIGHDSSSHDAVTSGERFGVHVLGSDQQQLARRLARRGADKFADTHWDWDGRVPRLHDALIYLPCRRTATFSHGDHTVVIGEVLRIQLAEGDPLIYLRRRMDWQPGRC